jgi:hypothetical protein
MADHWDGIGMFVRLSFGSQEQVSAFRHVVLLVGGAVALGFIHSSPTLGGPVDGNGPVQDQRRPLRVQHSALQRRSAMNSRECEGRPQVAEDAKPVAWSVRQSRNGLRTLSTRSSMVVAIRPRALSIT